MNSVNEKEKKLNLALTKLKSLSLDIPDSKKDIEDLTAQRNQLEIEKQELEDKFKILLEDHNNLSKKLDQFYSQEKIEQKKQLDFSEKIDELNQETDTLIEEIDKWQT